MGALDFDGIWKGPANVGTRTLGTAWRNIGTAMKTGGALFARHYLSWQIHNGTEVMFRVRLKESASGSSYRHHNAQVGSGVVTANGFRIKFTNNADTFASVEWGLDGTVPYIQLQAKIVGGSATYVSHAKLVTGR
jgi:hypothetical protein